MTNNTAGASAALKQKMTDMRRASKPPIRRSAAGAAVGTPQVARASLPQLNGFRPLSPPMLSEHYMPQPLPRTLRQPLKRRSVSDAENVLPKTRLVSTQVPQQSTQPALRMRPLLGIQRTGPDGQVYIEIIRPLNEHQSPETSIEDAYFVTEEGADTDGRESSEGSAGERAVTSYDQISTHNTTQLTPSQSSVPKCSLFCYLFRIICRCSGNYTFTYGKIVDNFLAQANINHYPNDVLEKVKKNLLQVLLTNECFEFAGIEADDEEDDEGGLDFSSHMKFSWKLASNLDLSVISTALANDSSHKCPTADSLLGITSEEEDECEQPVLLDDLLRSD
ncbi:hypothetical protein QR680_004758 [Steinernema hermaphroditum]|uniref:Uncharacterized protein n=1 Tax=Steinernema hermaphroditum TaxID=289476 RepID=A0AA39LUH8_9BILA|nr:hypothetical protein QR680_004758 [Steinernema hermaphroditum]